MLQKNLQKQILIKQLEINSLQSFHDNNSKFFNLLVYPLRGRELNRALIRIENITEKVHFENLQNYIAKRKIDIMIADIKTQG